MAGLTTSLGLQTSQTGYVASILQSDTMMRRVSSELNLAKAPGFAPGGPNAEEKAQTMLKRSVTVKTDRNGAVAISARSRSAQLSADIINHMLNNLGKLFKTKSQQKAAYIETQIKQTQEKLKVAEQQLLRFQQSNKIALIDEETKSFIQQIGTLESQLISLDVELQQAKSELADEGDLEELVKLRVKKRSLESSRAVLAARLETAKRQLADAPQASLEYARITRSIAMQSKTIEMLTEQYQLASLTQHGEDGDYQVIDWGQPRYEPVGPRSAMNAFLGGSAGALLACLLLLSSGRKGGKVDSL
jgi:uncharacterized protein involved in exopolysaccharide biosynthesis